MTTANDNIHCTCCGIKVPVEDSRVSDDVAKHVRELRRNAKPIEAITELRRLTGMSLRDAKFWAEHCGEPIGKAIQTGPCPFCGRELRTDAAQQCRHCLRDWHDPSEIKILSLGSSR